MLRTICAAAAMMATASVAMASEPAAPSADYGKTVSIKVSGMLECSDGAVLHEWCLAGHGLAWRSSWETWEDIAAGRLVTVLDAFAAPPIGIHAVFPQRRHLPLRVRLFLDFLKHTYERPGYWQ